jgi:hypothetical protein
VKRPLIVVALVLGLGLLVLGAVSRDGRLAIATASTVVTPGAPQSAEQGMSDTINGRYGDVPTVTVASTTSLSEWAQLEPHQTDGLSITSSNAAAPVYGFVITGTFTDQAPPAPPGAADQPQPTVYHQGRVVTDANGNVLAIWLWPDGRLDAPSLRSAFGSEFNVS